MTPSNSNRPTFVVGIGASAGGLKPIEDFFDHMPIATGMAFVIVQHLSPDFKSLMDELLARHTDMAIHKVSNGVQIEANSIYLIPPEKNMVMSDGKLLLTDKESERSLNLPIDIFFRSLAKDAGENTVAIILSGTGSDGSRGIKDVREAGGLIVVQNIETAGFDGMPRAAIGTGVVDLICPPSEMPDQLIAYVNNGDRSAVQQSEFPGDGNHDESTLLRVFRLFRQRHNVDFSLYKPATINRRLERRVRMSGIPSLEEYVNFVESDQEECESLFRDLLVEVTHFFRDPQAFQRLRDDVIPELIERADDANEIRVWVCGCATGEEAYSMALLLAEGIEKSERKLSFKVFATDVHRKSLEIASTGFYPVSAMDSVPPEFHAKYFVKNNGICNIRREIRQRVIFAANDITRDPPFTRIDLLTCRNVLIYLEPRIQKRILSMFHFGLKPKGILLLGPSETVGDLANEFEQIDRHWRIYRKRRDIRLPESTRMPLAPVLRTVVNEQVQPFVGQVTSPQTSQSWLNTAYEDLLAKHVPPSFLINEFNELVHCFGSARKLLSPPEGKATNDVVKMLDPALGVAVSAAIHRARSENIPIIYKGIRTSVGDEDERLYQVTVEPYQKTNQRLYLVALEETEKVPTIERVVEDFQADTRSVERIGQLERELNYTRETLQATVEELESSNEELQATNEELIASNEELQSTNEELHSVNEELYTVNSEHKQKIEELTELTSDMDNLLRNTEIGTIFLDQNFNIRMFTPSITAGFNVLDQDVGRPIDHIAYKLDSPNLLQDAAAVLNTGTPRETEVRGKDGVAYLQRIQPYRVENEIGGVVLTLTDISAIKEAEKARATMLTLAEVSQELPDFAYAVSHDLQAPLRHISQYSEILDAAIESKNQSSMSKSNQIIKSSTSKLRTMIDGLLAYSRINSLGRDFEKVDLSVSFAEAVAELQAAIDVNNASIEIESELPTVMGDSDQLKLLFFHLLDNALKYRTETDPVIKLECLTKDNQFEIHFQDNGIGINERYSDDIFTIFKRLGVKDNAPGAGVGLAICRRIVLRHHGRIWATANEDGGLVVCFTISKPEEWTVESAVTDSNFQSNMSKDVN